MAKIVLRVSECELSGLRCILSRGGRVNKSKQGWRFALALLGICFLVTLAAIFSGGLQAKKRKTQEQLPTRALDSAGASLFKVDPFWPKPLPNRWSMQQVTGLYVDDKTGHIWFLNRGAAADG